MSTDPGSPPPQSDPTLRRVLIIFGASALVLVFLVVVTLRNLSHAADATTWRNQSHTLLTALDALQSTLMTAEADLNRYLLTADARDQNVYQGKRVEVREHVAAITTLLASAPEEQKLFVPVTELLNRRTEDADRLLALKQAGDTGAVRQLLIDTGAQGDLGELQRRIERLREHQMALLATKDSASSQQAQSTRWIVMGGLVVDLLLLGGAVWVIRDALATRHEAARLLQTTNEQLEERVRQRTAELSATNAKLLAQNIEDRWAKQATEHQNRYNLLIIDAVSDSVFVVTKLMNVSRMNPSAVHLTGVEPSGLIDKPFTSIVRLAEGDGPAPTYDPFARALAEGHELKGKRAIVTTKGGQSVPVRLDMYPLRDRDQVVGGVIILQTNATSPLS
jgi:CHASE3 domain sensor protein